MAEETYAVGDYFAAFIEQLVKTGRFETAGEVVTAGLRFLEEREAYLEFVRKAVADGITSGLATPFDFDEFIERKRTARESSE